LVGDSNFAFFSWEARKMDALAAGHADDRPSEKKWREDGVSAGLSIGQFSFRSSIFVSVQDKFSKISAPH
jgi:hypothetical protein